MNTGEAPLQVDPRPASVQFGPAVLAAPEARTLAFEFRGSAAEYFRIWIVNVCLSFFTLGVYSAWAKVRKKRYLYSHTLIDGTPFQYLGRPMPILKGRLIAAAIYGMWFVATRGLPVLVFPAVLAGLVMMPWIVVRSAAFTCRYSAFRNMTFRFDAGYWMAARTLLLAGFMTLFTLGIGYPWARRHVQQFLVGRAEFGGAVGRFKAEGLDYFKIYLAAFGVLFLLAMALTLVAASLSTFGRKFVGGVMGVGMVFIWVGAYAFVASRHFNLVWNSTQIGPLRFRAWLRGRDVAWLYLGNTVAVLCTFGLLIPWATVRMARYRADHFEVLQDGSLDRFVGQPATTVRATGAEVADLFDFDLSV